MDERTLNDLLECSVCLERLDTTSKVLPCQHTFCRKCLEIIVSSHTELRCPECRVLIEIKIDDLPPNVLLMRILEGMKNASYNQLNSTVYAAPPPRLPSAPPPTTTSTTNASTTGSQQLLLSSQQTNSSKLITNTTNRASDDQQTIISRQLTAHFSTKPTSLSMPNPSKLSLPHAKALYDFISKENGDISFKKGEMIMLRKRIDLNWFVGEINGREGVFPINHVQVIVPLPQPQCKALYDFRMGPNEEEGCLTFKKGAIINVFRRVDHNWAEGRIGDCIGIFPIAFVEMNSLAKQIMEMSAKCLQFAISTRSVPPTPPSHHHHHPHQLLLQQHGTAVEQQNSSTDSSSSTVTTSPNSSTSSNTSSSNSSTPSSPINNLQNQQQNTPAVTKPKEQQQQRDKRHSMTALTVANKNSSLQQANRHSAEILSAPEPSASAEQKQTNSTAAIKLNRTQGETSSAAAVHNITKSKHNSSNLNYVPNLPATYVALYPYKPQKSDELELKKGSVYFVTERCQDGWFKGTNRGQKSGVFPGNYVAPLRNNHRENNQISNLKRQSQQQQHQQQSNNQDAQSPQQQQPQKASNNSTTTTATTTPNQNNTPQIPPPELPPRSSTNPISTTTVGSVWSKPLGQHVDAFFNRKSHSNDAQNHSTKDKKESSAVGIMKRLTYIKRSKSPNSSAYSMDNPVFEDTTCPSSSATVAPLSTAAMRNAHISSHPVHVRSGSCPSQLLQSLPLDLNNPTADQSSYMFGSQRVKGPKERPTLQGIRNSLDTNHRLRGIMPADGHSSAVNVSPKSMANPPSASTAYHRKSQSLDAATISSQILINNTTAKNPNKTYAHNERFRCIVSYPPNGEYELELNVGDVVFVHKKRDNGWYKGTHSRTGKIGLFPASFVEPDI